MTIWVYQLSIVINFAQILIPNFSIIIYKGAPITGLQYLLQYQMLVLFMKWQFSIWIRDSDPAGSEPESPIPKTAMLTIKLHSIDKRRKSSWNQWFCLDGVNYHFWKKFYLFITRFCPLKTGIFILSEFFPKHGIFPPVSGKEIFFVFAYLTYLIWVDVIDG